MIITKQYNGEIEKFIEKHRPNIIIKEYKLPCDWLSDTRKIIDWCKENFIDDAAAKISEEERGPDTLHIKWYIANEADTMAFKLRWA